VKARERRYYCYVQS